MNGELAETICLIAHASAWLASQHADPPRLEDTSAFQYVASLRFLFQRSVGVAVEARDVESWMRQLAERGIKRLWLVMGLSTDQLEERRAVAFSGRGSWAIVAGASPQQELWRGSWAVGDRDAPDQKIWHVVHTGAPVSDVLVERPRIDEAQAELVNALQDARLFSKEHDLDFWADWFNEAIAVSAPDVEPRPRFHDDLLPRNGYTPQARRLLAIAINSWVFGGMGSWNDIGVVDDDRYRLVSQRLYSAMMESFLAAVNSALDMTSI